MRISDWSSDVCSSDLATIFVQPDPADIEPFATTTGPQMPFHARTAWTRTLGQLAIVLAVALLAGMLVGYPWQVLTVAALGIVAWHYWRLRGVLLRLARSEEHTSELQSLMRISYAVFCLKNKQNKATKMKTNTNKT